MSKPITIKIPGSVFHRCLWSEASHLWEGEAICYADSLSDSPHTGRRRLTYHVSQPRHVWERLLWDLDYHGSDPGAYDVECRSAVRAVARVADRVRAALVEDTP